MGCGMSARLKRARPSVSVTEQSTQHEFLTEAEGRGEPGAASVDTRSSIVSASSSRRNRSIGSLFHSRKVKNLSDDEVVSTSAVETRTASSARRTSVPARVSPDQIDGTPLLLPGETNIEARPDVGKVRIVDAKEYTSQSADNNDVHKGSPLVNLTRNNSGDSSTGGSPGDKHCDRVSVDSGFPLLDSANRPSPEKNADDDDEIPEINSDHAINNHVQTIICDNDLSKRHHGNSQTKDNVTSNRATNGVCFEDTETNSSGSIKPKASVKFANSYVHKDSGIEVQSDLDKDADTPSSGDSHGNHARTENGRGSFSSPCKTIGVKTLEQIIEVGKMVSNPVEHNVIYETAKDSVTMTNGVTKLSSHAMVITDVADEEVFSPSVAKATASSIEHQVGMDGELMDEDLWPGLVVVHVHQDFYNDFDDCFDDEEMLISIDSK